MLVGIVLSLFILKLVIAGTMIVVQFFNEVRSKYF
ncbi:hypothetical protein SA58113_1627 [Staphylococcus argenteus]|nr:hypothetical protein SA58113_1627 [Staphylococcus argenteus]